MDLAVALEPRHATARPARARPLRRGSQALVPAAKARAALRGEAAADVDDVRALVLCRCCGTGSS